MPSVAPRGAIVIRSVLSIIVALLVAACASAPPAPTSVSSVEQPAHPRASASPAATHDPTPTATPDLATRIQTLLGSDFNGSALVVLGDDVLFAEGLGMADDANDIANKPVTRFRIGSITKQFTAMAILMLAVAGAAQDNRPDLRLRRRLPRRSGTRSRSSTCWATRPASPSFTDQPDFDPLQTATPAETVASVADIPLAFTPGDSFSYSNTGYILLGMVIQRVSGHALRGLPPPAHLRAPGHGGLRVRARRHRGPRHRLREPVQRSGSRSTCPCRLPPAACTRRSSTCSAGPMRSPPPPSSTPIRCTASSARSTTPPTDGPSDMPSVCSSAKRTVTRLPRTPAGSTALSPPWPSIRTMTSRVVLLTNREDAGDVERLTASVARLVLDNP